MTCGDISRGHEGPISQLLGEKYEREMNVGNPIDLSSVGCSCGKFRNPHADNCNLLQPKDKIAFGLRHDEMMTHEEEPDDGKAKHFSSDKSAVDQIPTDVLMEWGEVFKMGAKKYGRDNWKKGTDWHEFYGSALRHLFKFWQGEDVDPESGLSHLAHALWNVAAIRHYQMNGLGTDTRTAHHPTCDQDTCHPECERKQDA